MRNRIALLLALFTCSAMAQSKEGFSLEMFGGASSAINSFGSAYQYEGVKDWAELPFEAGAGFAFRKNAGSKQQWGLKLSVSRLAFGYRETGFTDNNGDIQELRPISTRRIYLNFSPLYSFNLYEGRSSIFALETGFSFKLPLNAYTLARDAQANNQDVDDLQNASVGILSVYQFHVAPTLVWDATRLGLPISYNMSSGEDWELLSGWSLALSLSYFIEE